MDSTEDCKATIRFLVGPTSRWTLRPSASVRPEQVGEDHHLDAHGQRVVQRILMFGSLEYRESWDHVAVIEVAKVGAGLWR